MSDVMDTEQTDAREPKPTALKGLLFLFVLIVIGALLALFVLQQRSAEGPLVPTAAPEPLSVDVIEVSLQDSFTIDEQFTGIVTPRRTSQLGFPTGGRIERLRGDVGSRVATGRVLAELDTRGLKAQLASAEALVAEAEAGYELAKVTVDRQAALAEKGHVSQQRVDEAQAQANTSKARIAAAQASADTLKVQIDLARITAPFSGTITARMADEGAIAAPGVPIFELVESGRLEARIGLTEELAARLETGQVYRLDTARGEVEAKLRAKTGVIDAGQRTMATIFDIQDASAVASGAVVRIALEQEIDERGLWLPTVSLAEAQRGLWSVYLARKTDEGWTAEPGIVEIVHSAGDKAYVRGAIRDGDMLILDGLQRVTPGQPVTPVKVDKASAAAMADKG